MNKKPLNTFALFHQISAIPKAEPRQLPLQPRAHSLLAQGHAQRQVTWVCSRRRRPQNDQGHSGVDQRWDSCRPTRELGLQL